MLALLSGAISFSIEDLEQPHVVRQRLHHQVGDVVVPAEAHLLLESGFADAANGICNYDDDESNKRATSTTRRSASHTTHGVELRLSSAARLLGACCKPHGLVESPQPFL